ncbi:MAG: alpha/beta fold hydrolase [Eggerthellaceae bacterium]|nr:alpha/beta fold hydrolase [Eggerthellaceae bacterium]
MGGGSSKAGKIAGIVFAVVVIVFFVGSFFVDRMILDQTYQRYESAEPNLLPTYEAFADGHPRTPVEFQYDGSTLRGYVYEAGNPRGFIVFRHGIFSQHSDYLALICAMVDRGWTVFAYDAIGCGESDGDSTIGMAQSPLDVAAAVQFVRDDNLNEGLPLVLWGHSWGGYGVAGALDIVPDVDACVTMSGFNEPCGILFETSEKQMGPFAVTQEATIWLNNKLAFGADADRAAVTGINKTEAPVLVIHGTDDAVISYDGASIMAQRGAITNPSVEYYTCDAEGRNGHNTYFYSEESAAYLADKGAELAELQEQYPDGIPDDVAASFLASYDVQRGNTADPVLIGVIDEFFRSAIGDDMNFTGMAGIANTGEYGALQSASYTDSGDMNGNLYDVSARRADDGSMIVVVREAKMHSDPISVGEYRVPDDLLEQINAIVDKAGMKEWGELPLSEFIALDASTPTVRLTYENASSTDGFPIWLSFSTSYEMPDDGKAFDEIRDLLESCITEENLIRTYVEEER